MSRIKSDFDLYMCILKKERKIFCFCHFKKRSAFYHRFFLPLQERVQNDPSSIDNPDDLQDNPLYFTRTKGLFRVCFPTPERPSSSKGTQDFPLFAHVF